MDNRIKTKQDENKTIVYFIENPYFEGTQKECEEELNKRDIEELREFTEANSKNIKPKSNPNLKLK